LRGAAGFHEFEVPGSSRPLHSPEPAALGKGGASHVTEQS